MKDKEGKVNAFEKIVGRCLEEYGYWVRHSVKVSISKQEKRDIGSFSMPTPEIDIVALNVKRNELLLLEVKSLLGSYGVHFDAVSGKDKEEGKRYKLFTNAKFIKAVTTQLRKEYLDQGLITQDTKISYGLAAGHIHSADEAKIAEYFAEKGWTLFTPTKIKESVRQLSEKGWEDDLVTMTSKLVLK